MEEYTVSLIIFAVLEILELSTVDTPGSLVLPESEARVLELGKHPKMQ
jgi:hypothetical protein